MKKYKLGIAGCGYLGNIIIDAYKKNLLSDYEIVGVYSRTENSTTSAAQKVNEIENANCKACKNIDELLELQPDYIVEAASVACVKEIAQQVLKTGCSLVLVSIGALADEEFKLKIENTAKEYNSKIYIASGAVGGFDVLRTISLMGEASNNTAKASFYSRKNPASLKNTPLYAEGLMQEENKRVFEGNAKKAIEILPTKVNVAVATALASIGAEELKVFINSEKQMSGDDYVITCEAEGVRTELNIYSATSEIAAWSVVSVLRNIASPIVF